MSKIGILGSGQVAQTLALGFKKHGHDVMVGSREPSKLQAWQAEKGAGIALGDFAQTAQFADIVVVAVLGRACISALDLAGHANLAGKVVIDTANPIDDKPPVHGVLQYFTGPNESLMEQLQHKVPAARLVKAFNSVGNPFEASVLGVAASSASNLDFRRKLSWRASLVSFSEISNKPCATCSSCLSSLISTCSRGIYSAS